MMVSDVIPNGLISDIILCHHYPSVPSPLEVHPSMNSQDLADQINI